MKSSRFAAFAAFFVCGGVAAGQDIFAIDWGFPSPAYCLGADGSNPQAIGSTGVSFLNSMAKDSKGRIFSFGYVGTCSDTLFGLDPLTGEARPILQTTFCSVRAMTFGPNDELFVLVAMGGSENPFDLFELDTTTGAISHIGQTDAIQGMTYGNGKLWGWHVAGFPGEAKGLVTIDPATAAITDVNPAVGGFAGDVQTLAFDPSGVLYGGYLDLFTVDTSTGVLTLVAELYPALSVRGFVFPDEYQVPGEQTVRVGVPANPAAFVPDPNGPPSVGGTWSPSIDHSSFLPGAVIDFVTVSTSEANIPSVAGTILCGPPALLFVQTPGAPFALDIPADCALIGAGFCTQGGSTDAGGVIHLTNAIDVKIEAF